MRINKWLAERTSLSRRKADEAISLGRVEVDGRTATPGDTITETSRVTLDGKTIVNKPAATKIVLLLNKPAGYVCSRRGQGNKTIYELLPPRLHYVNPVGRLDKDSSGLLVLTNDGPLANRLMHPRFSKEKVYEVVLDKQLKDEDRAKIEQGVELEDGVSSLKLEPLSRGWKITMHEGRNRQIRRTFAALGYAVTRLNRTDFGPYKLNNIQPGMYIETRS